MILPTKDDNMMMEEDWNVAATTDDDGWGELTLEGTPVNTYTCTDKDTNDSTTGNSTSSLDYEASQHKNDNGHDEDDDGENQEGEETLQGEQRHKPKRRLSLGKMFKRKEAMRKKKNAEKSKEEGSKTAEEEDESAQQRLDNEVMTAMQLQLKEMEERIQSLQQDNDKLVKEAKKVKRQLRKERSKQQSSDDALSHTISLHGDLCSFDVSNHPQQPSSSAPSPAARLEDQLQLECYEKMIESKDKSLSSLKKTCQDQEKRISYLEVLCLQNKIEIGDDIYTGGEEDITTKTINKASTATTTTNTTSNEIYSNNSCGSCASFFNESGFENDIDDDIWEEPLDNDGHKCDDPVSNSKKNSSLESALSRLPGGQHDKSNTKPNDMNLMNHHSGISEAVVSLALEDIASVTSSDSHPGGRGLTKSPKDSWLKLSLSNTSNDFNIAATTTATNETTKKFVRKKKKDLVSSSYHHHNRRSLAAPSISSSSYHHRRNGGNMSTHSTSGRNKSSHGNGDDDATRISVVLNSLECALGSTTDESISKKQ